MTEAELRVSESTAAGVGLALRQLHKSYGSNHVVRGLELALARGEVVALLGPSGCGKTTALRMVAGLESPDSGSIEIAGRVVRDAKVDLPPEQRRVGMVFQSYAVWPHRNVRDNVAYPLQLLKDREAKAKADRALELVQLPGLGSRFPHTLSGGQQQRVALARALVAEPELLLFDEPLSNLDAKLREEMRHEIRQLAKKVGTTSLYVTHDQPEAFAVSDRVAVVLQGQIAALAPPEEMYAAPPTLAVAQFVGRLSTLSGLERVDEGRVRLGDLQIPATWAFTGDGAAVLGVRPEAVRLARQGESSLAGRVVRATFLGERTEVQVQTPQGSLKADLPRRVVPREGDLLNLVIEEGRVYPAPESPGDHAG